MAFANRFTPTPVGNTISVLAATQLTTVHPHACGEYTVCPCRCSCLIGSPPRLWGILVLNFKDAAARRFTPTPVGNTQGGRVALTPPAVHPHACGEYHDQLDRIYERIGSPPRLWGIRCRIACFAWLRRFTPTPVGNTNRHGAAVRVVPVHPHACGEYLIAVAISFNDDGSPPRLWGILITLLPNCLSCRFTPTPVGNTPASVARAGLATVHPHACGEYGAEQRCRIQRCGSPPRLWGIRRSG